LNPEGVVVGIEYDWSHFKGEEELNLNRCQCPVVLINGNSHYEETKTSLKNVLRERPIDVLFIDGDHSWDGCKQDFDMYGELVRSGGIIAIHDTQMHRRPDEDVTVKKCGEFFASLPEPKFEKHTAKNNWDGYGIGFIYKK
jgi:predicted O-methyltransferase YrrM